VIQNRRQSFPPRYLSSVRADVFIYSSSRSRCARLQPSSILSWMPTNVRYYSGGQAHYSGWPDSLAGRVYRKGCFRSAVDSRKDGLKRRSALSYLYSPLRALNFECLDMERSFLVCLYIFGISRSSSYIRVTYWVKVKVTGAKSAFLYPVCEWSAIDWNAILLLFLLDCS